MIWNYDWDTSQLTGSRSAAVFLSLLRMFLWAWGGSQRRASEDRFRALSPALTLCFVYISIKRRSCTTNRRVLSPESCPRALKSGGPPASIKQQKSPRKIRAVANSVILSRSLHFRLHIWYYIMWVQELCKMRYFFLLDKRRLCLLIPQNFLIYTSSLGNIFHLGTSDNLALEEV